MIRKCIPLIGLFLICAAMLTACSKDKEEAMEKNTFRTYGNILEIALEANSTTGFTWHFELSDENVLSLKDSFYNADDHQSGMTGVGGTQVYIFEGLKEGICELSLFYYRNWEKEEHTADYKISIAVSSDLAVSVTDILSDKGKTMQTV